MTTRSTLWLHVCLCFGLMAASRAGWAANPTSLAGASGGSAPGSQDEVAILEHARAANENLFSALQSFVCDEEIERFRGSIDGGSSHALDTVTAKLSFERGVEQYSEIYQNKHPRPRISSLAGAWSEGEYGTLLLQTQQLLATQSVRFETYGEVDEEKAAIYHFDVASDESPWDLMVGGRHYRLSFSTDVWISIESGEILKINRTSLNVPAETHISEVRWNISLDRVDLNGRLWLLPTSGTYVVAYNESHRREWNLISFTNYQRYGAETALKFD